MLSRARWLSSSRRFSSLKSSRIFRIAVWTSAPRPRTESKSSRMFKSAVCTSAKRPRSSAKSSRMFRTAVCRLANCCFSASESSRILRVARWKSRSSACRSLGSVRMAFALMMSRFPACGRSRLLLLQLVDLFLQLDHAQLAPEGELLEPLQLRQALEFLGALVGDLRLRLLLGGDVTRGGEHADDLAALVAVDRGVVEHVGEAADAVADGEGIIGHHPLREHLTVAFLRLFGLGEVVREVGADQLFARHAGDLDGGLVDVRDLAVGADGDERIERGLDQA